MNFSYLILLFLIPIVWEDFKSRQITLLWFIGLFLVLIFLNILDPFIDFWNQLFLNSSFFGLQLILLSAYFSLKNKRLIWIGQIGLGLGDILFLFLLCLYFPFLNYFTFYFISLIWSLLLFGVFIFFSGKKTVKLPLAGLQALLFIILLIISLIFDINLRSDTWLLNLLPL